MVVQDQNIAQDCTQLIETPGCNQEKEEGKTVAGHQLDQNFQTGVIGSEQTFFGYLFGILSFHPWPWAQFQI